MLREGSIVAVMRRGDIRYGQVMKWKRKPDDHLSILFSDGSVERLFYDSLLASDEYDYPGEPRDVPGVIPREMAKVVRAVTDALARRKEVKHALSSGGVTARIDRHGQVHRAGKVQDAGPRGGIGYPLINSVPWKLAKGFSSNWSTDLENYLTRVPTERQRLERDLDRYNHRAAEVFIRHVFHDELLSDIGEQLGIAPSTARWYQHKAKGFTREWLGLRRAEDAA